MKTYKKTILIDLDGVLNEYKGNYDKNLIPEPKEGTSEFLEKLNKDYELKLFTTRDEALARTWLEDNNLDKYFSSITNEKELSWLIIDDRCLKFEGDYDLLASQINNFKPWYKS